MSRRGVALPAALHALVAMALLVAVAFHAAHLEQRAARTSLYAVQAAGAADGGTAEVLGSWESIGGLAALAVGDSVRLPPVALGPRLAYAVTVTRVTSALYVIRSEGRRTDAAGAVLARREVAVIARSSGGAVSPLLQRGWAPVH